MKTLQDLFNGIAEAIGVKFDEEQTKKLEAFSKASIPTEAASFAKDLVEVAVPNFKASHKKAILDEEDTHFEGLKDVLGEDVLRNVMAGRGTVKVSNLKKAFADREAKLKADLSKANKGGNDEEAATLRQKITDLEAERENLKQATVELNTLKSENSELVKQLSGKDSELKIERFSSNLKERTDLSSVYKKGRLIKNLSSEILEKIEKDGFVADFSDLNARLKKADGSTSSKSMNDLVGAFILADADLKVTSEPKPAEAASFKAETITMTPAMLKIAEQRKLAFEQKTEE